MKNKPLKVLIIGNFASSWGGNRGVSEELAERLSARGHHVLSASREKAAPRRLLDMTSTAWRCRADYDVAHLDVFSGAAFFWAEATARVLKAANKPFMLFLRGGGLPEFAHQRPHRVRCLLRAARVVAAPSRFLQTQMQPYRDAIQLLPNPLEIAHYPFRLRKNVAPHLVWLRAFDELYNPSLAPRVLALLQNDFPDVHLTMYGPDKGDGSLQRTQQTACDEGVEHRITLPGGIAKSAVPKKLNESNIFLSTTDVDNTPVSVLEAMACGLPVVSTDVGGMPYLIENERDGLLVPPNDAPAMAAALSRVLAQTDLAARLSRNGRDKVEQMDWNIVLPQWENLLRGAAQYNPS